MTNIHRLRANKLWIALSNPVCWPALRLGVAPTIEHLPVLKSLDFDGVLDVGANRGQFTLACQLLGSNVPVVAFEPIPSEAKVFRKIHGGRSNVVLVETALGEQVGEASMHISQIADSSSLLPIGRKQTELFNTSEVARLTVSVDCLDNQQHLWEGRKRQLLKLDVQGYELQVLRGAPQTLKTCAFVYAECSEIALYEGQSLRPQVDEYLRTQGFASRGYFNPDFDGSQLVQADWLYARI